MLRVAECDSKGKIPIILGTKLLHQINAVLAQFLLGIVRERSLGSFAGHVADGIVFCCGTR